MHILAQAQKPYFERKINTSIDWKVTIPYSVTARNLGNCSCKKKVEFEIAISLCDDFNHYNYLVDSSALQPLGQGSDWQIKRINFTLSAQSLFYFLC